MNVQENDKIRLYWIKKERMNQKELRHFVDVDLLIASIKEQGLYFKRFLLESGELSLDPDAFAELYALMQKEAELLFKLDEERKKGEPINN